jgi:hypothetical protein
MLLSKNLIGILHDFVLDIMLFFLCIYLVCACFFVDKYLCDIVHLEKLIHIRDDTSPFDIFFICCMLIGHAKKYNSLKTMMMLFAHPYNSLIICFIMPFTYPLGWAFLLWCLLLVAQLFVCCKCLAYFSIYDLLQMFVF